jgi:preprotein translocase subunit Sec63
MFKFIKSNLFLHNQKINLNLIINTNLFINTNTKYFSQKVKLDPYLILEINRNADWKTIKKAYFKLARLYHPDLNKNDEVRFK